MTALFSALALAFSMTLFTGLGCSSRQQLDATRFFGMWAAVERNDAGLPTIEFFQDGTFTATNLPLSVVIGPRASQPTGGGSGTWKLVEGRNGPDIQLAFAQLADRTSGFAIPIHISGRKSTDLRLFFWKGEAGEARLEFVRQSSPKEGE